MSEQLQSLASNYFYVIPFALLLTFVWHKIEKTKNKHPSKNSVLNQNHLYRLMGFIAVLTFTIVYANKPLPKLEESIIVSPADF